MLGFRVGHQVACLHKYTQNSFERWKEDFETDVYSSGPVERDVAQRVIIASGRECYSK